MTTDPNLQWLEDILDKHAEYYIKQTVKFFQETGESPALNKNNEGDLVAKAAIAAKLEETQAKTAEYWEAYYGLDHKLQTKNIDDYQKFKGSKDEVERTVAWINQLSPWNLQGAVDQLRDKLQQVELEARKEQIIQDFLSLIDLPPNFEEQDLIEWRINQLKALGTKDD